MSRNKARYENKKVVADQIIFKVTESIKAVFINNPLLQKTEFEDVRVLSQLGVFSPAVQTRPWTITRYVRPSREI